MNTSLIANPKATFLLGASLDVLHHESIEWLETIDFWKDEMQFFEKLLNRSEPILKDLKAQRSMLDNLGKIQKNILPFIKEDVIEHEGLLARLEQNKEGASDWDYREKHRKIKSRIDDIAMNFKIFKRTVFDYVHNL